MRTLAPVFLLLTASVSGLSGSDSCLSNECQGILLLCSNCSYPLQTGALATPVQAQCICYAPGFTDMLNTYTTPPPLRVLILPANCGTRCINCMAPYQAAIYSQPAWDRLCAGAVTDSPGATAAGDTAETGDPSVKIAGARGIADGRTGCVVGGVLVAAGMAVLGM